MLDRLDRAAKKREQTRSGFIAEAVRITLTQQRAMSLHKTASGVTKKGLSKKIAAPKPVARSAAQESLDVGASHLLTTMSAR